MPITIHYSEIKKHIIGKNHFWGYSTIFISLILGSLIYISGNIISFSRGPIFTLLIFCLLVLSTYYILINLCRCRRFYKLYNSFFKQSNAQFCKIVVEKEGYQMKVPTRSYNVTIHPCPKLTNAVYFETDDYFLLFFTIQSLGFLQQVLRPFIFIKNNKEFYIKDTNVNIIRNFETIETEENRTIIFPNNYGITKVIILRNTK